MFYFDTKVVLTYDWLTANQLMIDPNRK